MRRNHFCVIIVALFVHCNCYSQKTTSIDTLFLKTNSFLETNQDSAFYYSNLAYQKAISLKDTTLICKAITYHSKNLINKRWFDQAEKLLKFNLDHKAYLDHHFLGVTYYNKGALHQVKEQRDLALENYFNALDLFTETNNHKLLAKTYLYIGVVIQKGKRHYKGEQADYFYNKSLQYSKTENKEHDDLSTLGKIPLDIKIESSKNALKAIKNQKQSKLASILHYNISKNYFLHNHYRDAIMHSKKSIEIKNNIGFIQNLDYSYFTIGSSYISLHRYTESIEPLYKVLELTKKRELRLRALDLLISAHKNTGNYKVSLNLLEELSAIKDSIALIQENERIAIITSKFETEKQAKEILELKQENQEKKLLIAKQENRRWRWALAVLISTIATIWLARRYLKSLKKVKQIEQEKEVIAKKVEEKFMVLNNKTKVYFKDLKYIKAAGNYLEFYTDDKTIIDRNKLKVIEVELPPNFIRTHRSYVVNKNYILSANSTSVIIKPNIETPLSRTFKGSLS